MDPDISFSVYFPLPYRVLGILLLGIWAWATNIHVLELSNIDTSSLFNGRVKLLHTSDPSMFMPVYRIAAMFSILAISSLLSFWTFTLGDVIAVREWEILPLSCLAFLFCLLLCPFNVLYRTERFKFLQTFKRVIIGGIDLDNRLGDVILADILTSYARVFGDVFVIICMSFSGISTTSHPDRGCTGTWMVTLLISLPSFIRLCQCLKEYKSSDGNFTHVMNAVKYASAFPVILLSAVQKSHKSSDNYSFGELALFRLWVLFVIINSSYSFYWDVTKDWDLTLLTNPAPSGSVRSWGLRKQLYFKKEYYYIVVIIDFLLRMTWSVKLSPHLNQLNEVEGGILLFEVLEVFRRWLWVFFRTEAEWIRRNHKYGLGLQDEILLGNLSKDFAD